MTKARDIASAAPAPSTVSATEIGYLDGVTSGIQTQINTKASTSYVDTAVAGVDLTNVQRIVPVDSNISVPGAPTSVSGTVDDTQSSVSFVAPTSNGGSTILAYTVISSPGNIKKSGTSSPIVITGLTNGTAYTFTVKAHNIAGSSVASTASGSVTPTIAFDVNYLVVAGGGGAGFNWGGGGGAGGLRSSVTATGGGGTLESALTGMGVSTNYTVTVGAGGAGGPYSGGSGTNAENGSNSVFSTITSTGGGRGGSGAGTTFASTSGGSGGGGGRGTTTTGSSGTANQGYAGGNADVSGTHAAGGGGAGAAGNNNQGSSQGGNGGAGVAVSITGSSVTYAGGGGAGGYLSDAAGSGGSGGGGAGATGTNASGTSGTANTGGGGGGASGAPTNASGGSGGSGVVIIKYPDTRTITIGAGLTGSTASPSGGYKVTTFTAGTGNITFA